MIPAEFEYEAADSVEHAIELLGSIPDERLIAGGQSLLPLMKLRLSSPALLVDLGRVEGLAGVREDGDTLAIGALTLHEDLHRDATVAKRCPLLAHAAGEVGDPQVRHRGTLGGSLAHAAPEGDLPAALLALEGELAAYGPAAERTIAGSESLVGPLTTPLAPQEVLMEVRVPATDGARWSYRKFHPRAQDWAIVGVAALANGTTRVALMSMGPTPLGAAGVEAAVAGGGDAETAVGSASTGPEPVDDAFASASTAATPAGVPVRRARRRSAASPAVEAQRSAGSVDRDGTLEHRGGLRPIRLECRSDDDACRRGALNEAGDFPIVIRMELGDVVIDHAGSDAAEKRQPHCTSIFLDGLVLATVVCHPESRPIGQRFGSLLWSRVQIDDHPPARILPLDRDGAFVAVDRRERRGVGEGRSA
jgi:carbon-monoxide dehydrogenase medium subunit